MKKITDWLKTAWNRTKGFWAFVFVAALLGGGWYVFLALINKPPLETTPVLIMVWASLILLILSAFPEILNRIKKLKVGDVEVELQDVLQKSKEENQVSLDEVDYSMMFEKGDLRRLKSIVVSAMKEPEKTCFLVVNVFETRISIFALAAYLYFLSFVTKSIVIIFVSDPSRQLKPKSIKKSSVIGVINGEIVLKEIFLRYRNIYQRLVNASTEFVRNNDNGDDNENNLVNFLNGIDLLRNREQFELMNEYRLNSQQVASWFAGELEDKVISSKLTESDRSTLKKSLSNKDEFIIVTDENDVVVSVIPIREYSRIFTLRIMSAN
jgi:PHD/YefM family antitoxin component YafN of YafNO toxin-antitoxin module